MFIAFTHLKTSPTTYRNCVFITFASTVSQSLYRLQKQNTDTWKFKKTFIH